ncbi:hypothetical protein B9Z55_001745 [Caenorhabditis nigoni]|uniref:Flavin-containing monooxygenase n=1 Tax=Caenorhabditis nigoni TaxID=1611254 RepID=A0A2G5VH58_9PELO|nr:hypothetical protein B9Z55_001745 [Caenorhabditis nigoni]
MPSKICIIGAGAAGLVTAKHAIKDGHQVEIFEQTDKIGGTWVYSEETGCHSSMYKTMKTNLPKQCLEFENVPYTDGLPSFLPHENVLEYLENYSKELSIFFNTKVTNVTREEEQWKVTTSTNSAEFESINYYDVVFVCNGHFFEPFNPFENSGFVGEMLHSHDYRRAEHFEGKKVVIVGAGPSGIDITLQVAMTARHVTLIGTHAVFPVVLPGTVRQIPTHVKNVYSEGVITDEGENITADVIIVCTGYKYKFPFMDPSLIQLKHNSQIVSPLYQHICHVDYPMTLFFIGLLHLAVTFPLFEVQAKYALSLVSRKGKLPSDIQNFEENRMKTAKSPRDFHVLVEEQWDYMKELAEMGGFEKLDRMEAIRKLFVYVVEEQKRNPIGYKMQNFEWNDEDMEFRKIDSNCAVTLDK